jgi:hypothetical protein
MATFAASSYFQSSATVGPLTFRASRGADPVKKIFAEAKGSDDFTTGNLVPMKVDVKQLHDPTKG